LLLENPIINHKTLRRGWGLNLCDTSRPVGQTSVYSGDSSPLLLFFEMSQGKTTWWKKSFFNRIFFHRQHFVQSYNNTQNKTKSLSLGVF